MGKVRIKWYTPEEICRGPDAINDILPLTVVNIKKLVTPMVIPCVACLGGGSLAFENLVLLAHLMAKVESGVSRKRKLP